MSVAYCTSVLLLLVTVAAVQAQAPPGPLEMSMTPYGNGEAEQFANAKFCMGKVRQLVLPGLKANGFERVGNVLRYSFHDCGTFNINNATGGGGCNGGIRSTIARRIADRTYNTPNNPDGEDNGMDVAQTFLAGVDGKGGACGQIRAQNPQQCGSMPYADCISFAGYLAVVATGGAPSGGCAWHPGRVDAPDGTRQETALLPSEFSNVDNLRRVFGNYAMPLAAVGLGDNLDDAIVLLSGGHTIGRARVHGKDLCNKGINALGATPTRFDSDYYSRIVNNLNKVDNNGGWFCSDMHGMCNNIIYKGSSVVESGILSQPSQPTSQSPGHPEPATQTRDDVDLKKGYCGGVSDSPFAPYYRTYARDQPKFLVGFCQAYQAMSLIGYKVPPAYTARATEFMDLLK